MATTVKDAILRGRKTVENVVEGGRKTAEKVVEGGLNTVETVVEAGLNTVDTLVVKRSQENLRDDLIFNNGAYADFIRIPARIVAKNTLPVPDHVPLEHAALTEPLACAVHGFMDSRPRPGDTVAVIGGGPLGLMILHV